MIHPTEHKRWNLSSDLRPTQHVKPNSPNPGTPLNFPHGSITDVIVLPCPQTQDLNFKDRLRLLPGSRQSCKVSPA